jgi:hypothetical protein
MRCAQTLSPLLPAGILPPGLPRTRAGASTSRWMRSSRRAPASGCRARASPSLAPRAAPRCRGCLQGAAPTYTTEQPRRHVIPQLLCSSPPTGPSLSAPPGISSPPSPTGRPGAGDGAAVPLTPDPAAETAAEGRTVPARQARRGAGARPRPATSHCQAAGATTQSSAHRPRLAAPGFVAYGGAGRSALQSRSCADQHCCDALLPPHSLPTVRPRRCGRSRRRSRTCGTAGALECCRQARTGARAGARQATRPCTWGLEHTSQKPHVANPRCCGPAAALGLLRGRRCRCVMYQPLGN